MATIDLTSGSGLLSQTVLSASDHRIISSMLPMTTAQTLTPESLALALLPQFELLQSILAALPADTWANTIRTLTGGIPSASEVASAVVNHTLSGELPPTSLGNTLKETASRVVSNL